MMKSDKPRIVTADDFKKILHKIESTSPATAQRRMQRKNYAPHVEVDKNSGSSQRVRHV